MANVFKKAAPRREHRERHQPEARKRLGLLEKKKDYKQRAGDYHRKEKKIQSLREKAAMKNPDEFYYGMLNSKTQGGVHVKEREEKYSNEELHLMKSQDLTYVEMKKTEEMKRIEKLSANLHCFDEDFSDDESGPSSSSSSRRHIVFVDNEKEAESFDAAEYFDTLPELVSRKYNRPRVSQLQKDDFILGVKGNKPTRKQLRTMERERQKKYKELGQRIDREKSLHSMAIDMRMKQEVTKKGTKKKVVGKNGETHFKWKRQRKR